MELDFLDFTSRYASFGACAELLFKSQEQMSGFQTTSTYYWPHQRHSDETNNVYLPYVESRQEDRNTRENLSENILTSSARTVHRHGTPETQNEKQAQAILYRHQSTPQTIVLDSRCPDLAPHKIITPPGDDLENLCNRLLIRSAAIAASKDAWEICKRYTPVYVQRMDDGVKYQVEQRNLSPQRVVKLSCFWNKDNTVDLTLVRDECVRHELGHAAETTSIVAQGWRTVYDSQIYLGSIERRFQWRWTDPAEPLLKQLGASPLTIIIILSDFPCSVPHIAIEHIAIEPAESNHPSTPEEQDRNFLTVDFGWGLHSMDVSASDDDGSRFDTYSDFETSEGDLSDDTLDTDSTSVLGTTELQQADSGIHLHLVDDMEEEDITDCYYQSYSPSIPSPYRNPFSPKEKPGHHIASDQSLHPIFFIYDDEEEDGPPEFDEWYTSRSTSHMESGEEIR